MSKKNGLGKFIAGAAIGVGLGVLFAPKKGSETRAVLKEKIADLLDKVKEIDAKELKDEFDRRINDIKIELADLDKEKVWEIAKEKGEALKEKTEDLVELAIEKGTPVLKKAALEVKEKAIDVTKDVLKKLENSK